MMTLHLGSKYKLTEDRDGVKAGTCLELTWVDGQKAQFSTADGTPVTVPFTQVKNLFTECRCSKCG